MSKEKREVKSKRGFQIVPKPNFKSSNKIPYLLRYSKSIGNEIKKRTY